MTQKAERKIHKCTCKDEDETEGLCKDMNNECACMTTERLRKVEQEWIERGIIR